MHPKQLKKLQAKQEAMQRIPQILEKAKKAYKAGNKRLALVYSKKVRHLSNRHKLRLPIAVKRQFCRHCSHVLIPGVNCRIRTREGKLVVYCLECRKFSKMSLR
ncbi:ribonuclease P [Candidatus Woesearchaeota archaeon]|nr:ribonuclease P [Candidatus Woesearchaeota archaeon]